MMKRLIRTTLSIWKMNPEMVEKLKDSLEEVGTINVTSYRSKFHILSGHSRIIHSEPSPIGESNHIEYLLNGVVVLQFFKGTFNVAGRLFEERIPLNLKQRTEEILAAYGLYTGKMAWKHAPWIPLLFLSSAALALLCALIFTAEFLSSSPISGVEKMLLVLFAAGVIGSIYQYKQYF